MPTLYDNFERVRQYIDQHQADVDLSSYATKVELASYVSKDELSGCGYVTSNDIPEVDLSSYATKADLNSYLSVSLLTKPEGIETLTLKQVGLDVNPSDGRVFPKYYASYTSANAIQDGTCWLSHGTMKNWVNGRLAEIEASYVTSSDLPVIDENIIPKETGTYTLGDSSHIYSSAYTQNVKGVQRIFFPNGSSLAINNTAGNASSDRYTFSSSEFKPNATGNISLGSSTAKWGATYTANLYADTIHNFIWTGTSAEYAALDNYTSYQIYMIKEA